MELMAFSSSRNEVRMRIVMMSGSWYGKEGAVSAESATMVGGGAQICNWLLYLWNNHCFCAKSEELAYSKMRF